MPENKPYVLRVCDICNEVLKPYEVGMIFYDYLYCPKCWAIHRENMIKEFAVEEKG